MVPVVPVVPKGLKGAKKLEISFRNTKQNQNDFAVLPEPHLQHF